MANYTRPYGYVKRKVTLLGTKRHFVVPGRLNRVDWRRRRHNRHHSPMRTPDPASAHADFHWYPGSRNDLLILCDHASAAIPPQYAELGLHGPARHAHICWDIGAGDLSRALAEQLDAPLLCAGWSRILVDCNRDWDDPTLILPISDGVVVPGNQDIDERERELRWRRFHRPYHQQIDDYLEAQTRTGQRPLVLGIHSFTPVYGGVARPWEVGILWRPPDPLAAAALGWLAGQGLVVGDNEPYSGAELLGHTLERHAIERGLPYLLIEVRQDLLDEAGVAHYARLLSQCVSEVLKIRSWAHR